MENDLLNQVLAVLIPSLLTLITGWFAVLGNKIKAVYQEKVNTEIKKNLVNTTVQFVQQVYKDLDGDAKLQKALEQSTIALNEKGITVSEVELRMLIESAVYGLKSGFYAEQQKLQAIEEQNKDIISLTSEDKNEA